MIAKMEMENPCGSALAANQNVHDIGSLPLELVLHIAQYLDGADIARSQMVRYSLLMPVSKLPLIPTPDRQ